MRLLENIHRADVLTFQWCLRRRSLTLLTTVSRLISKTADGHLYLLTGLVFAYAGNLQILTVMMVLFTFERLCYFILKNRFRRNRPPQAIPGFRSVIIPSDQFSFPSGHTSAAFLCAGIMASFFPELAPILYPWAALVGCSRVMLGVHFPTDTVAGAILGSSFSLFAYAHNGLSIL